MEILLALAALAGIVSAALAVIRTIRRGDPGQAQLTPDQRHEIRRSALKLLEELKQAAEVGQLDPEARAMNAISIPLLHRIERRITLEQQRLEAAIDGLSVEGIERASREASSSICRLLRIVLVHNQGYFPGSLFKRWWEEHQCEELLSGSVPPQISDPAPDI